MPIFLAWVSTRTGSAEPRHPPSRDRTPALLVSRFVTRGGHSATATYRAAAVGLLGRSCGTLCEHGGTHQPQHGGTHGSPVCPLLPTSDHSLLREARSPASLRCLIKSMSLRGGAGDPLVDEACERLLPVDLDDRQPLAIAASSSGRRRCRPPRARTEPSRLRRTARLARTLTEVATWGVVEDDLRYGYRLVVVAFRDAHDGAAVGGHAHARLVPLAGAPTSRGTPSGRCRGGSS